MLNVLSDRISYCERQAREDHEDGGCHACTAHAMDFEKIRTAIEELKLFISDL